jgi:hypothetical protein
MLVLPGNIKVKEDWKRKRDKNAIAIHVMEPADSPIKKYKAHMVDKVFTYHSGNIKIKTPAGGSHFCLLIYR